MNTKLEKKSVTVRRERAQGGKKKQQGTADEPDREWPPFRRRYERPSIFSVFVFLLRGKYIYLSLSLFLRNKRNPNTPLGDNIKKERSDVTVKIHRPFYLRPDMIFRSHLAKGCHDAWLGICIVTPLANSIITVKRRISTTNFLGGTTGDHSKIGPTVRIKTYIFTYYC